MDALRGIHSEDPLTGKFVSGFDEGYLTREAASPSDEEAVADALGMLATNLGHRHPNCAGSTIARAKQQCEPWVNREVSIGLEAILFAGITPDQHSGRRGTSLLFTTKCNLG